MTNTRTPPTNTKRKRMTAWPHARQTQTPCADQHTSTSTSRGPTRIGCLSTPSVPGCCTQINNKCTYVHLMFADDDVTLLSSCAQTPRTRHLLIVTGIESSVAGFARTRGHGPPSDLAANPQYEARVCGQKEAQSVGKGGADKKTPSRYGPLSNFRLTSGINQTRWPVSLSPFSSAQD